MSVSHGTAEILFDSSPHFSVTTHVDLETLLEDVLLDARLCEYGVRKSRLADFKCDHVSRGFRFLSLPHDDLLYESKRLQCLFFRQGWILIISDDTLN